MKLNDNFTDEIKSGLYGANLMIFYAFCKMLEKGKLQIDKIGMFKVFKYLARRINSENLKGH